MSLRDLEKMGLIRPKEQWGQPHAIRRVPPIAVGIVAAMAVASVVTMILADGGVLTWVAIGTFLIALLIFTALNVRASGSTSGSETGSGRGSEGR